MKIIVTGGAGFVGSSVCIELKRKYPHYNIIAFDNLRRRGSEINLADLFNHQISFLHGDIRNWEDIEVIGDFDVMIDASAEPSVLAGIESEPTYVINNNLHGSLNCFKACLKNQAKLIFFSTSRVYPINRIEEANIIEETTRFAFARQQNEIGISNKGISEKLNLDGHRSFYGATKLASELFIKEYVTFYGLEATIIRLGVIAGPRQMGKTDQGIATLWMANHFWKRPITYIGYNGTGKQVRDIIHINDVVALVDNQIHHIELFSGKIYNVGGGVKNSVSLLEMTEICQDITGNKVESKKNLQNRSADLKIYISDTTQIEEDLGWMPTYSIQHTLEDIYTWIKVNEKKLSKIL